MVAKVMLDKAVSGSAASPLQEFNNQRTNLWSLHVVHPDQTSLIYCSLTPIIFDFYYFNKPDFLCLLSDINIFSILMVHTRTHTQIYTSITSTYSRTPKIYNISFFSLCIFAPLHL